MDLCMRSAQLLALKTSRAFFRTGRQSVLVLTVVLCSLISSTGAKNAHSLEDDFEYYPAVAFPISWGASGLGNGQVIADALNPGNQVLELIGSTASPFATGADRAVTFPTNFSLSIDINNGSQPISGGIPARGYIYMRPGPGFATPSRTLIGFNSDGNIVGTDGSVLQTYSTDTWYNLAITYDLVGSTLTLGYSIDGMVAAQITSNVDPVTEANLSYFQLTSQAGSVLYDNVSLVPEPSSAVLMSLGLAALGIRRRT